MQSIEYSMKRIINMFQIRKYTFLCNFRIPSLFNSPSIELRTLKLYNGFKQIIMKNVSLCGFIAFMQKGTDAYKTEY